jgi:hypothetical protein
MCFFLAEPILTMEKAETVTWEDGWTTVTADGSWAAQFKHTVLVTRTGAEILTKLWHLLYYDKKLLGHLPWACLCSYNSPSPPLAAVSYRNVSLVLTLPHMNSALKRWCFMCTMLIWYFWSTAGPHVAGLQITGWRADRWDLWWKFCTRRVACAKGLRILRILCVAYWHMISYWRIARHVMCK